MQGLGFSMCVRACMCACVYVYWFGWQDHFIIFLFLKNSNLKKNFFQRAPLSKANCCFSVYCHLSLLILPSEKRHTCLVEGKKQMGGWLRSWELEISPRPEETCLLKGRGMWLLSASLRPLPLEYMKLQALLCFKRQLRLRFFWYSKMHQSLQKREW